MIFQSPYPDIEIPEAPVASFILEHASQFGSRAALIDGKTGHQLTYDELAAAVDRTASGLAARGFGKGDVFAINCSNTPEYGVAFLAVAQLGGVATMVSPLFNEAELTVQLKDSGAHYLMTDAESAQTAIAVARAVDLREVFVLGESNSADDVTSFSELQKHNGPAPQPDINPREDVVALPYSSGTTGWPKGVMLTHYNLVAMLRQLETAAVLNAGDRVICVVPCYHVYGFHVVMNLGLRTGATVVTLPRFELEDFLAALQKYEINIVPVVPPIVLTLARSPLVAGYDLSKLETLHCGAAPLSVEVASAACERLGVGISYGYGMTELSPLSHLTYPANNDDKPASAGYCLPNTTCKIVGIESRVDLEPGEEGEVCVRGPQVMKGYLGQPEATTELIDSEGWLRTGDIGYADQDGALYIVDRLKELIKYKGRQVAPAELEAVLLSHPAVADAAVLPSPDEQAGEVPIAFVVLKEAATGAELMDYVAERVAPYKKIRRVEFIDHIPKSPAGKILRRVLALRVRQEVRGSEEGGKK